MKCNTPVLFVIFNRPEIAQKTFESIRRAQPKRLYIASDGARQDRVGETELVARTRQSILQMVDWECEVKTLFQETNLGCGPGVYTAISWLFEQEEQGIILEDDCVASESFFLFMEEMLQRYATDQRIGMVAGFNPIAMPDLQESYLYSRFKSCWGWGSWRRAWQLMDMSMQWRRTVADSVVANCGFQGKDRAEWLFKLKCIDRGYVSAWDWQWYFSLSAQNQLCVYPKVNLVSNIGDDASATHTSLGTITLQRYDLEFPLQHPVYMMPNLEFDRAFYKQSNSLYRRITRLLPHSLKARMKQWLIHWKK